MIRWEIVIKESGKVSWVCFTRNKLCFCNHREQSMEKKWRRFFSSKATSEYHIFCESAMREILRAEIAWHNYISSICNVILWNFRLKWIWEQESIIPQRGHPVVSLKLHLHLCPIFVIIIHRFEDRVGLIVRHGFH